MRWPINPVRFIRDERGMLAAMAAVMLTALVGITGAATDLGLLYTARNQLQNAADASALAAADAIITYDSSFNAQVDYQSAWSTAQQLAASNQAIGVNLTLLEPDFVVGKWDLAGGQWISTGSSSDPNDINAVQVTLRRDETANSPVSTYFAGIVGYGQVGVSAASLAFIGYAGSSPEGALALPIAVAADAVTGGDDAPDCGQALVFHDERNENAEWTTFFDWPSNDPNVRDYVCGCKSSPALKVGDDINVINGNLSNQTFEALAARFQDEGEDVDGDGIADQWLVTLPVVEFGATTAHVTGFAYFTITEVRTAPDKEVVGVLQCGMVVPDSATGGEDYGARAGHPKLIY